MRLDDDDEEWDGSCDSGLPADHSIDVVEVEDPVVGVIYGPAGEVLSTVYERPTVPFGFRGSRR